MKKINLYLILSVGILVLISSCKDVFDVDRVGAITPEQMWDSPDFVSNYVNTFYTLMPGWSKNEYASGECNPAAFTTDDFIKGKLTSTDNFPGAVWNYSFNRSLNVFFENILSSTAEFDAGQKEKLMGQAYFFRAYLYYKMVRGYGGVPIITTVQNPAADINELFVKRNSTLECFNFIEEQIDSAIMFLPVRNTADYGKERVTKAAAMALKAEILLTKASPLFCKTRNEQYWQDAYNAALAAKNECDAEGYGLFDDGTKRAYDNMQYNKTAALKEMILYVAYKEPEKTNPHIRGQLPLSQTAGATGGTQPTWEMVQAYSMKDGKDIEGHPDYDPSMFWVNREPRFYYAIVYHGAPYGLGSTDRRQWVFEEQSTTQEPDGYQATDGTYTGFYCRRGVDTTRCLSCSKLILSQDLDWAIIRYPEVLLNLAECANQLDAHRNEVRNLLIPIRQRAGIEPGAENSYGLASEVGTDKTATLEAIMKERQVEFAFEDERYWDLRRNRMFSVLNDYEHLHGMKPNLNMEGLLALGLPGITEDSGISEIMVALSNKLNTPGVDENLIIKQVTNFTEDIIDKSADGKVQIPDNYYFYPINPEWIQQNPELEQNSGWENGTFDPTIQ